MMSLGVVGVAPVCTRGQPTSTPESNAANASYGMNGI